MSKRVTKLFNTKAASINEEAKSVTFVISTNEEDRYGEVVDQKTWDFKSYLKNPLVLWGHDPDHPENVLGTASELEISQDGKQTTAVLTFATDINAKAELVWQLIKRGVLRTVSVGFWNHSFEIENDIPILKDNELLEISVVPIPANPGAIALGLKSGEINRKDAKWLMDGLRKEADLMEKQYEATKPINEEKTKSMTDAQATALIEGMTKLTEKVDALATENQSLKEQIAAEQKTREEEAAAKAEEDAKAEAEAKAAAEVQAEADKKAADDEAARVAAEEAKKADDLAKGGDNDQPGAKDDDFDEDAEITSEEQAEIDAELEAAQSEQ